MGGKSKIGRTVERGLAAMRQWKQLRIHYGWVVLAVGTLGVFGALGLARFGYTMVLPSMVADLRLNNEEAGLLATFNLGGYLAFSLLGGALAARYGARWVASLGLLLAGLGMLMTGMSADFFGVAVWRTLTGIGSGAGNIGIMGLWAAWFARRQRGLAAGIAVSGSSVALIFTGLWVPAVIDSLGNPAWRTCWFVYGGVAVAIAIGMTVWIRNSPADKGLSAVGEAEGADTLKTARPGQVSARKMAWRKVYASWPVWHLGLVYSMFGFAYIIFMTFFVKHLVDDAGYTRAAAGSTFMTMGWLSLFCGFIWGAVSDRIGRKKTIGVIFLIQAMAYGFFAMGNHTLIILCAAVLFGLTAWSIPAIMAAACGDALGPELAPAALGLITLFFGIGQALGPYVAGMMADATGTFSPAFWMAAGVSLVGAVGSAFLKTSSSG